MENYREQNEADVCYMEIKTKINVLCFFFFFLSCGHALLMDWLRHQNHVLNRETNTCFAHHKHSYRYPDCVSQI